MRLLRLHSARGSAPVSSLPSSSSFSSADTFWNAACGTHRCQHPRFKPSSLPPIQAAEHETAEDNGPLDLYDCICPAPLQMGCQP